MGHGGGAEHAVRTGETVAPLPLLTGHLDHRRIGGNGDIFVPGEQPRRQHSGDADPCPQGQPLFELDVLRLVMGFVPRPRAVFEQGQRQEKVEADKGDRADVQGDHQGVVDRAPVGGDRSHPPRAEDMEQDRTQDQQHYDDCDTHPSSCPKRTSPGKRATFGSSQHADSPINCADHNWNVAPEKALTATPPNAQRNRAYSWQISSSLRSTTWV